MADVDGLTARILWEASGGNLLLHQELVTAGLETGALRIADQMWSWQGPLAVTPRLLELTEARLGWPEDEQKRALELLAIASPIGLEEISQLVTHDVLEDLEAKQVLLTERSDGRMVLRFRYPVDGQVLRAHIPELRARRYRLDLVEAIERVDGVNREDLSRIALWRLECDVPQRVETLVSAARGATDLSLVRRLGQAALRAGAGHRVTQLLGDALLLKESPSEAETALAEVAGRVEGEHRARVDLDRALNALLGKDDIPGALALVRQVQMIDT